MSEMLERCAQALHDARLFQPGKEVTDLERRLARAVIEAMREPDQAMIYGYKRGLKTLIDNTPQDQRKWPMKDLGNGRKVYRIGPRQKIIVRYQAMIDTILNPA